MTRLVILLILSSVMLSRGTAGKPPKPSWEYPGVKISGWHAQAVAVAMREFQKNQGGRTDRGEPVYGDLRHYTVDIRQSPPDELPLAYAHLECVRVSFNPKMGPKDWKENTLGGRTQYGIEVSYDIARRNMKIIKTSFAR